MILSYETAMSKGKRLNFRIAEDIERKIIFESIKLFEFLQIESNLNEIES
ncbi:hypothetical protein [Methanobrevibacter sp.]